MMTVCELFANLSRLAPAPQKIAARRLLAAVVTLVVAVLGPGRAAAQSLDERFLEGLRQRQLFNLAEKFCRDRLARSDLPAGARAELTIELARCLTDRALSSGPQERDKTWAEALATCEEFAQKLPQNPRLVQVLVQRGLVQLAWGELLRQEADLSGRTAERLAPARDHLRLAIDELERAVDKIAEITRRQQLGRRPAEGELTVSELRSLDRNVHFQLARALRNQGESYPADSPDRVNSLTQAVELLSSLAQGEASDPLTWPSRLDAATCYRLLGHREAAARRLDQVDSESPPPRVELRARAERIRLALAEQHVDDAVALAEKARVLDGQSSAELDYAALEAYLAAWRRTTGDGRAAQAKPWEAKAAAMVRDIDRAHGPYWRRRAEGLFAEQVAANPATTDVAVLARAAEGLYRSGEIDEALAAYDRAAGQARTSGQEDKAFELGYAAAAIEQERKQFAAAAERFRQVAIASPKLPGAAAAHLLAAYDLGQQARVEADGTLERYVALLEEHLATWPTAASADRAHLWLARVRERDQDWQRAVEQYAAVRPESEAAAEALPGLARSYQAWLAAERAVGKPTSTLAATAVAALESSSRSKNSPTEWTSAQLQGVLAAAQILLDYSSDGFARAEKMLTLALPHADDAPDEWRATAQVLLVYAIAAQGRSDDAARHVDALAKASPQALGALVEGLDRLGASAQPAVRANLATLALRVIEMAAAETGSSSDEERRALALARGRALLAAGQKEEAVREMKKLAAAAPRDGRIQEALARLLWEADDSAALEAWLNVARKSRSGSERWLRAKLYEALIYERRGERQRAAQTIGIVQKLYPELGGPQQKQQFLELLKRCESGALSPAAPRN